MAQTKTTRLIFIGEDGDQRTAQRIDFVSLAESPCGFGETPGDAARDLLWQESEGEFGDDRDAMVESVEPVSINRDVYAEECSCTDTKWCRACRGEDYYNAHGKNFSDHQPPWSFLWAGVAGFFAAWAFIATWAAVTP